MGDSGPPWKRPRNDLTLMLPFQFPPSSEFFPWPSPTSTPEPSPPRPRDNRFSVGDSSSEGYIPFEDRVPEAFAFEGCIPFEDIPFEDRIPDLFADEKRHLNEVFLSFRGDDTRRAFVSHIYSSLRNAGIHVFKDDETLPKGCHISSILREIENSKISIIVFSRKYPNSKWCLLELERIMSCHSSMGQVVLPVFLDVDPSEVRHQNGSFGEAFADLANRMSAERDRVMRWRKLLHQAASIAGFVVLDSRNESEVIEDIVESICNILEKGNLFIADHPVGVKSRVQEVTHLLNSFDSARSVIVVGILGMGGVGKTTLAKAIYNDIGKKFEGRSFLENIREVWEQDNGKVSLQQRLLSNIYRTTKMKILSIELGKCIIKEGLVHKRILLILDDVNKLDQLKALYGSREWFCPGSIIFITTRDEHILKFLNVDYVCRMKGMDESESLELFSWHAFKQASPKEYFAELSRNVVAYSGGLPLALEVLGSFLFAREISEWESALKKLKSNVNGEIQEKLKISYDDLDYCTQNIFLDISCFFIGMDRYIVTNIMNECKFSADIGIPILIERSLITVDKKNKIRMHDLLRDMGREIIREKSPNIVENHKRLWLSDDDLDVLEESIGTKFVEGLVLMLPRANPRCLSAQAFEKMKRLRLLQLGHVKLKGDYKYLSKNLKWLRWHGFPLRNIPSELHQGSLVAIQLKCSYLKMVWKNPQLLVKLKFLNLSHSHDLKQSPDFSNLPNLERLVLKDCSSLSVVHHTIGQLCKLLLLNLEDCKSLANLPKSIYELTSLKTLILSGCSNIQKLEEDVEQMKSLTSLIADNTAITKVPFSIVRSKSIAYISLCGYEGSVRDVFPSLIWSWMSPKNNPFSLVQPSESLLSLVSLEGRNSCFHGLSSIISEVPRLLSLCVQCGSESQLIQDAERILNTLYVANYMQLEALPSTSQVSTSGMETMAIIDGYNQIHISAAQQEDSLRCLLIQIGKNDQVMSTLTESIFQKLETSGCDDFCLPGDKYPDWLTFCGEGPSVIFKVPHVNGCKLKRMALCIVYLSSQGNFVSRDLNNVLIINYTKTTIQLYKRDMLTSFEDEEYQSYVSNLEAGDKVEIMVVCGYGLTPKKTAVYLVYDSDTRPPLLHTYYRRQRPGEGGGK